MAMAFERDGIGHEEIRPGHSGLLAAGTLACPRCDAPVSPGDRPLTLREAVACPFCTVMLDDGVKARGDGMRVVDVSTLLVE